LPYGAKSQNVPLLTALKAGSLLLELLLFIIAKLGEVGVIPHLAGVNIYCIRVTAMLVLVLVLTPSLLVSA